MSRWPVFPNVCVFDTYSEDPKVFLAVCPVFIGAFQQGFIEAVFTVSIPPKPVAVINTICNTKAHIRGLLNFMSQTPFKTAYKHWNTHLSGIGKRAWRSRKKYMTEFYQGKARGGDQTEFHREGDRCSSWTSQEEWASQGGVGGESILGKGSRIDRVTETQNAWDAAGKNEQVCVGLSLACMSSLSACLSSFISWNSTLAINNLSIHQLKAWKAVEAFLTIAK